jgi:hypothetical protein
MAKSDFLERNSMVFSTRFSVNVEKSKVEEAISEIKDILARLDILEM